MRLSPSQQWVWCFVCSGVGRRVWTRAVLALIFCFQQSRFSGPGCWVGQLASRRQSPQAGADSSEEGDLIKGEKFKERTFVVYDVDLWPEVTAYRLTAV